MKTSIACMLAALIPAAMGCAGSKPEVRVPEAPVPVSAVPADFADTPMMISSSPVEPAPFNLEIGAAARRGEAWVGDPGEVALRISRTAEAPRVRLYRADNRVESPDSSTVTVIMDRLPDDAVAGVWTRYRMARSVDGSWRVAAARQAILAWRGEDTETYRGRPAP